MTVLGSNFATRFVRTCADGYAQGWHEANGGNLSYRLTSADVETARTSFSTTRPWNTLSVVVPSLAGAHFMVTRAGAHLRDALLSPEEVCGIVQIDETGCAWRTVWGFAKGGRPTSELSAHLLCHTTRLHAAVGACAQAVAGTGMPFSVQAPRVIYHAHAPNIVALSTLISPSSREWSRTLWKTLTESVIAFPQGIGALPWMIPGTVGLGRATAQLMNDCDAVVWAQHGIIASGGSTEDAFGLVQTAEKAAGIYLAARGAAGGREPNNLVPDAQLLELCHTLGITPREGYLCL